ncbi:MAG TPA: hypothetical protein VN025_09200 [Candidatus Dormibacteraeota bacterium]|nr:hypothetical protein [Candidatus Dormibacteraeota bacterium]
MQAFPFCSLKQAASGTAVEFEFYRLVQRARRPKIIPKQTSSIAQREAPLQMRLTYFAEWKNEKLSWNYDRRFWLDRIELAKVNATKQAMANDSTKTITGPSAKHLFDGKSHAKVK